MGMGFPFGSARRSGACKQWPVDNATWGMRLICGDPNPARFEILRSVSRNGCTLAEIIWPDAKNYDGRKIAVYHATLRELAEAKCLDPHFAEQRGPLVPVARFEPTERGWEYAVQFINSVQPLLSEVA